MSRVATAVIMCAVGLSMVAGGSVAGAPLRLASHIPGDGAARAAGTDAGSAAGGTARDTSSKPPARQVPVAPDATPADSPDIGASADRKGKPGGDTGAAKGDVSAGDPDQKSSDQKPPGAKPSGKGLSDGAPEGSAPAHMEKTATPHPPAKTSLTRPGLPVRKPPKPVSRPRRGAERGAKKPPSSRAERDKRLCRALQSCRNGFVRCKSKIKYPDQSEPWIIAKEVCGAQYKACVEKDFKSGEWAFTRWFYFQELKCE